MSGGWSVPVPLRAPLRLPLSLSPPGARGNYRSNEGLTRKRESLGVWVLPLGAPGRKLCSSPTIGVAFHKKLLLGFPIEFEVSDNGLVITVGQLPGRLARWRKLGLRRLVRLPHTPTLVGRLISVNLCSVTVCISFLLFAAGSSCCSVPLPAAGCRPLRPVIRGRQLLRRPLPN